LSFESISENSGSGVDSNLARANYPVAGAHCGRIRTGSKTNAGGIERLDHYLLTIR